MMHLICGGQFGSEGKGSFAHWYGQENRVTHWGRAGGPQAGHSVNLNGRIVKLRQLPVGALMPGTVSVIGPGAVVEVDLLRQEVRLCEEILGHKIKVGVDPMATVVDDQASAQELAYGLIERIGSTGEGVGAARASRIWRQARTMGSVDPDGDWELASSGEVLYEAWKHGREILLEGTQGAGLSLTGPYYPFVTSQSTHPTQLLADMELPSKFVKVVACYRTFPIRVGGNSGPLHKETDWETLQARYGEHIPTEETTVTKRIRRVGEWDPDLAKWSVGYLRPHQICLTFLDYPYPEIAGQTKGEIPDNIKGYIHSKERDLGHHITYVGTGFGTYLAQDEGGW